MHGFVAGPVSLGDRRIQFRSSIEHLVASARDRDSVR